VTKELTCVRDESEKNSCIIAELPEQATASVPIGVRMKILLQFEHDMCKDSKASLHASGSPDHEQTKLKISNGVTNKPFYLAHAPPCRLHCNTISFAL
jgi:hypothetical protein